VSVSEDGVARGEDNGGAMAKVEMWEVCSGAESLMLPPGVVGGEGTLCPLKVEEDFLWVQHHKILQTVALEEGGFCIDKILTMIWLLLDALHAKVADASLSFTSNKRRIFNDFMDIEL